MIEARELEKDYAGVKAVRGVSFSIGPGEIVGLLGPNGAGKTTIMKILTCYHFPSGGTANLDGFDVVEEPIKVKERLGYLPENAPLYHDFTVRDYLGFIADARGLKGARRAERTAAVVDECGLAEVFDKKIETLSKGYRQRVGLAQAIIHEPSILILDEPTTGLDPNQIIEIRDLIRALGKDKTVILSTHIMQEVEAVCSRVLILNEGRIAAQGTAQEIGLTLAGGKASTFALRIKGIKEEAALMSLKALGGVSEALVTGPSAFKVGMSIEADAAAEALFRWAVGSGATILELSPQRASLEEIFVKLTKEGGAS
jgi:ABC-2 type transport system ATP-binding protein